MTTQLEQQRQLQIAQERARAIQPVTVTPNQGSVVPAVYQRNYVQEEMDKYPQITPPTEENIKKNMWIASGMVGLMAALATGNVAGGIAAGMVAAVGVHDHGFDLRQRGQYIRRLQEDGYSYPAILAWYKTGDNKELDKEREYMLQKEKFEEGKDEFTQTEEDKRLDREQRAKLERERMNNQMGIARMHEAGANARAALKNKGAVGSFDPKSPTAVQDAESIIKAGTVDQRKDALLASKMKNQAVVMQHLLSSGSVSPRQAGTITAALGAGTLGSLSLSTADQIFINAASEIVNASMRRESGSAISESEWRDARERLLPKVGDSDELIVKKMNNIEDYINGYAASSGAVYPALNYLAENRSVVGRTRLADDKPQPKQATQDSSQQQSQEGGAPPSKAKTVKDMTDEELMEGL